MPSKSVILQPIKLFLLQLQTTLRMDEQSAMTRSLTIESFQGFRLHGHESDYVTNPKDVADKLIDLLESSLHPEQWEEFVAQVKSLPIAL